MRVGVFWIFDPSLYFCWDSFFQLLLFTVQILSYYSNEFDKSCQLHLDTTQFVRLEDTSKYPLRNLYLSKKTHMAHCKNIRMTKFTFFIAWRLTNFFQILRKFWRKFIEPRNLSEALGVLNCYSCLRSGCVESRIQMYFSCLASHMSDCVPSRLKMSLFYVFLHLVSN